MNPKIGIGSIELNVESLAYGGAGVARHDGKVYFVHGGLPGDLVELEVTSEKKSYVEGKVKSIKRASEKRIPSPCKHSTACGGCPWIEFDYSEQWAAKVGIVEQIFKKMAIEVPKLATYPAEDPESAFFYRNRIQLRGRVKNRKIILGYMQPKSRDLAPISECVVADRAINLVLAKVLALEVDIPDQAFRLEIQSLPASGDKILLVFHPILKNGSIKKLIQACNFPEVAWKGLDHQLPSEHFAWDLFNSKVYLTTPGLFQQVNISKNHLLRNLVKKVVESLDKPVVWDLFCGTGNLSLPLVEVVDSIAGVEFSEGAIKCAKVMAASHKHVRYEAGDSQKIVEKWLAEGKKPDVILVDPPRRGMKEVVPLILRSQPELIVYVSCDPTTLARDVKEMANEYKLISLDLMDFFPNTYHVESLAVLKRI